MQLLPEIAKISRIHVDAITVASNGGKIPRRIWVATDASFGAQSGCTAPTYFWPIPEDDGPPMQDTTFTPNYCLGLLEESVRDWQNPGTWKVWRKLEMQTDTMGSATVAVVMTVDGTMSAPFDNVTAGFSQSPKDWHYFTNASNTAVGQSSKLSYRAGPSVLDTTQTQVVRSVVERGTARPRSADVITVRVMIADHLQDRHHGEMRDGQTMLSDLRQFGLSQNPFPLVDLVGATYPVVVQPDIEEIEEYQGSDMPSELIATVKIGVLDASWPVAKQVPFNPFGR